jgi:hypothetical protein
MVFRSAKLMEGSGLAALTMLPKLMALTLEDATALTAPDFTSAFLNVSLSCLQKLIIWSCPGLNDTALAALDKSCPNLHTMDLTRCEMVTDVGVREVLLQCQKLQELLLFTLPKLTPAALQDVWLALPMLQRLQVEDCSRVSDNWYFFQELLASHPGLEGRSGTEHRGTEHRLRSLPGSWLVMLRNNLSCDLNE